MGEEGEHWRHNTGGPGLDLVPVAVQSHGPVAVWRCKKKKKTEENQYCGGINLHFQPQFPFLA